MCIHIFLHSSHKIQCCNQSWQGCAAGWCHIIIIINVTGPTDCKKLMKKTKKLSQTRRSNDASSSSFRRQRLWLHQEGSHWKINGKCSFSSRRQVLRESGPRLGFCVYIVSASNTCSELKGAQQVNTSIPQGSGSCNPHLLCQHTIAHRHHLSFGNDLIQCLVSSSTAVIHPKCSIERGKYCCQGFT